MREISFAPPTSTIEVLCSIAIPMGESGAILPASLSARSAPENIGRPRGENNRALDTLDRDWHEHEAALQVETVATEGMGWFAIGLPPHADSNCHAGEPRC